jgi:regulator of replication initiation timing
MTEIDEKLRNLQGQILGLKSILTAIVEDNPDIIINEQKIGRLILGSQVEHPDVQMRAREVMHIVLSGRDDR